MLEVLEDRVTPSNWLVNVATPDSATTVGTLRYAITNAAAGDTITFSAALSGQTINLANPLTLNQNVSITGLGPANLAISGQNTVQVFNIPAGVTASISSLTIRDGHVTGSGGGVSNLGTLMLTNDTITGNVEQGSNLVNSDGGGIFNGIGGVLTLCNSTVSGNSAVCGGGISNQGTMTVFNSTISGNNASSTGGGIVIHNNGILTLSNSTVFGNHATESGGGISVYAGTATLSNDTIAYNSGMLAGGLYLNHTNMHPVTLYNTIIASNTASMQNPDGYGTAAVADNNLIANPDGFTFTSSVGNFLGVAAGLASSLANNGGPTQTLALLPGSVANNNGGALTLLALPLGMSDTTVVVQNAAVIARTPGNYYILVDQEQMLVTGINIAANTLTVQRGVNGTTASGHSLGAGVSFPTDQRGILRAAQPSIGAFQLGVVNSNTTLLPANATSITINGSAFDPVFANDSVTFSNGVTGTVTAATTTSLTVNSLVGLGNVAGGTALMASAVVDGVPSASVQVATVAPVVTASSAIVASNAVSMTIAGFGFDTNVANDILTFDNGVTGTVRVASGTSLTISLSGLAGLPIGTALHASITVNGISSGSPVQVATVGGVVVAPVVAASSANLPANAASMTIAGSGFDTTASHDSVTFDNGVVGTVTAATSTSLTVSLAGLASVAGGTALHVSVTVNGSSSGTPVQVATVAPVVAASTAVLNSNATSMTIAGSGFDTIAAHDAVTFDHGVIGSVTSATSTSLTISLTGLSSVTGGTVLHASVTVNGATSGSAVQVATVDAIIAQPSNQSISVGQNAAFTAATSNAGDTVQWQVNTGSGFTNVTDGGVYGGSQSPTLTITAASIAISGAQYRAVFTNSNGTLTTNAAALTVSLTATTTTLIDNGPSPSNFNQSVSFTATVSGGSPINAETITIEDADNANAVVASPTLTGSTVTFTIANLSVGTHHLFAVYNGDATHAASNNSAAPVTQIINGPAPAVTSVLVNGGAPAYTDQYGNHVSLAGQNSVVEQILVTFSEAVTLDPGAFTITNDAAAVTVYGGPNPNTLPVTANVAVVPLSGNTQFIVTFSGPGTTAIPGGSGNVINDGVYTLNTVGSKVHANNQTAADNNTGFWALYGSAAADNVIGSAIGNGNSEIFVDTPDAAMFKLAVGSTSNTPAGPPTYNVALDSNLDGNDDNTDYTKFRNNFGSDWSF